MVLPFSGVSRHHAVLIVEQGGLIVEDRGSKNGTSINGERVVRSRLVLGDELTLGSTKLRLEPADPDDTHLALKFDSTEDIEPAGEPSLDLRETDLLEPRFSVSTASQLQWIEAFVERWSAENLAVALQDLGERLGSLALGVFVLRPEEEPAVLGAAGDLEALGKVVEGRQAELEKVRLRALAGGWQLEILEVERLVAGLSPTVDGGALALLILGDFPGRSTCGPWLRLFCRLLVVLEGLDESDEPARNASAKPELSFPSDFVKGASSASQRLYRELRMVCGGDYPVLILGETGSGKEMVARTLHRSSPRAERPFIAVNCAAIPADLLEAEMFGVARGAATGVAPRPGCFRRAQGGALFLDEIGEMQPGLQAKLLRVLEYGEMQPVGGSPVRVDVRILSATNVEIEKHIAEKTLRADLYYRLAAAVITVPALRERSDDLPLLIQHFLGAFGDELGRRFRGVTHRALSLLMAYPWPGNVRELQHEMRRLAQQTLPGQIIDSMQLPGKFRKEAGAASAPTRSLDLRDRVAEVERQVILEALERTGGHRTSTAKLLGISRNTLASKIALYGLS